MSSERAFRSPFGGGRERLEAVRLLDRWTKQGFDTLVCYPSGFCSPANSSVLHTPLPDGYCANPIDSEEALTTLMASIKAGASYRV